MKTDFLVFAFNDNKSLKGHFDLLVKIPVLGVDKLYDSYWLADNERFHMPAIAKISLELKMRFILETFIEKCINRIRQLPVGEPFFIPFGLYDEYTDYLEVKKVDEEKVMLRFGWTIKAGVDLYTLDQSCMDINTMKYTHGPKVIRLQELLYGLGQNLGNQN